MVQSSELSETTTFLDEGLKRSISSLQSVTGCADMVAVAITDAVSNFVHDGIAYPKHALSD